MQTISYSEARNSLKTLCDEVRESHEPALITRKGGDVVLIGAEDSKKGSEPFMCKT